MTLEFAKACFSLSARATPSQANVNDKQTIGVRQINGEVSFSSTAPDIVYEIDITSTGSGDVATLDLTDGTVAQTTGTPTITRADGKDFEGVATATPATGQALLTYTDADLTGAITQASSHASNPDRVFPASQTEVGFELSSHPTMSGTIAFTFAASGDTLHVVVLAKSS